MSTLQSEIQIAICPRPTLARLVCPSQLSRLRSRSSRYECPRYGEDLHDLIGLRAHESCFLMQHIANAHPKVRCCGTLLNESDLDMHYLTSRNHPVCSRCNVGFPTDQEYAEVSRRGVPSIYERSEPYDERLQHNSELHSELQCRICTQQFPTVEALRIHAGDSSSHRRCEFCSAQFKDTSALVEVHSPLWSVV